MVESEMTPTIVSLLQRFECVRQSEISRVRRRLGKLSEDQENAIDLLTRAIIDKILDAPVAILKVASAENESAVVTEVVHRIFNL